jgi:hypothetical protein
MSSYTLLGKSPLLATSLADRPFDESLKLILNLVPTKMKFFPIHYFSTDDLITVRRKVSLFDSVLPEIVPKKTIAALSTSGCLGMSQQTITLPAWQSTTCCQQDPGCKKGHLGAGCSDCYLESVF